MEQLQEARRGPRLHTFIEKLVNLPIWVLHLPNRVKKFISGIMFSRSFVFPFKRSNIRTGAISEIVDFRSIVAIQFNFEAT